ncbi:MAG TPA: M1 family metallopeptidase [Rhodanobacteraceae bacterium]
MSRIRKHPVGMWLMALVVCLPAVAMAQQGKPVAKPAVPTSASTTPVPFVSAHAADFRVPSAANAWGGPRTAADATLSDEVVSYTIKATLDPDAHTVDAVEHMTWRNRSKRPISKVYFHLYLNAFENPGSLYFTERRMFAGSGSSRGAAVLKKGQWGYIDLKSVVQGGQKVAWHFVHPDGGPKTDHTVVEFDLPKAIPAGGTMALDIAFHDKLPRVVERTGWFGKFHLVAQWFPKIGVLELPGERGATQVRWNVHAFHYHSEFYADYGNYDVTMTVPKNYIVGAVGVEQGKPAIQGNTATWHFVQHDVEDFAWVAAPDYGRQFTTWTGPGSPKVTVEVIYPPEYKMDAQPILEATTKALTYFSDTLGPYPYKTVTAVVPPYNASEAGGMEYPTFFTADAFTDVTPGTASRYMLDFVTIHEFGHGYFMGILGSNEFEEPMLDEGMNRFWDDRMLAHLHEGLHLTTPFLRWLGIDPSITGAEMGRMIGVLGFNFPSDPLDENSWDRMSNTSYGSVYMRTEATMVTLQNLLGHKVMGEAIKAYYERWKFRHPSAADLRTVLEQVSGKPKLVDRIFDEEVYGTRRIDDRVVGMHSEWLGPRPGNFVKDGKRVTTTRAEVDKIVAAARKAWQKAHPGNTTDGPYLWRNYVTVMRDGAAVPETLEVTFADGSSKTVAWTDGSRWKRFHWDTPSKVVSAQLDPEHKIMLDANMLNNSYTVKANPAAAHRWAADFASLVKSFYTFVVTL